MILISMSYGEWDDYNSIPIMVVPTLDAALLIAEDLCKGKDSEYFKYVASAYGSTDIPWDADFSCEEIAFVNIE